MFAEQNLEGFNKLVEIEETFEFGGFWWIQNINVEQIVFCSNSTFLYPQTSYLVYTWLYL